MPHITNHPLYTPLNHAEKQFIISLDARFKDYNTEIFKLHNTTLTNENWENEQIKILKIIKEFEHEIIISILCFFNSMYKNIRCSTNDIAEFIVYDLRLNTLQIVNINKILVSIMEKIQNIKLLGD